MYFERMFDQWMVKLEQKRVAGINPLDGNNTDEGSESDEEAEQSEVDDESLVNANEEQGGTVNKFEQSGDEGAGKHQGNELEEGDGGEDTGKGEISADDGVSEGFLEQEPKGKESCLPEVVEDVQEL